MGELLEMSKSKLNKMGKILNSLTIILGAINIFLGIVTGSVVGVVACMAMVTLAIIIRGLENE